MADEEDQGEVALTPTTLPEAPIVEGNWTTPSEPPTRPVEAMRDQTNRDECRTSRFCCAFLCFPVHLALSGWMIALGVLNVGRCPIEPFLPHGLIALGTLSLVFSLERYLSHCFDNFYNPKGEDKKRNSRFGRLLKIAISVSNVVLLFVTIIFAGFVYANFVPELINEKSSHFCDKWFYTFSFAYVTFSLAVMTLLVLTFVCCCFCCSIFFIIAERRRRKRRKLRQRKAKYLVRPEEVSVNVDQAGSGNPDIVVTSEL